MKEYSAHLIPEGGYNAMPKIYGDGWLVAGDAGMFVNCGAPRRLEPGDDQRAARRRDGAGAGAAGKPYTARTLRATASSSMPSFVMKDLKKYRNMPEVLHRNPQFFTTYPELINQRGTYDAARRWRGQEDQGKGNPIGSFTARRSLFGLVGDAFKMWRAFG